MPKGKNIKTDRKKGVPFKMMFRHHMDPDYYDPKANDKIFVPDVPSNVLTDKQKQIIEFFPERDRGIFKEGQDNIVEEDPLEAVVKKMKLRKKEKALKKKVTFGGDNILKDDQEEDDDDDLEGAGSEEEDEDEEEYDEEDGDYDEDGEEEIKQDGQQIAKTQKKADIEDANVAAKKIQKLMPAEGVKFTMYDEYGLPKNDGFNYKQFIVTDDMKPSDLFIPAPPEMVEQMYVRTGFHRDVDKEISQMTDEEKAVFFCMTDDVGDYDELEDDFLMLANEGKPAIIEVEETISKNSQAHNDTVPEFANKGVVIIVDEEEQKLKALREKYKKQLGIGQKIQEDEEQEGDEVDEEDEDHDQEEQEEEKKDFMAVLDNEYADDQIGDVDLDDEPEDLISKELLDEALEEFIESQKLRDRKLYKEFKGDDKPDELIPMLRTKAQLDAEYEETEAEKEELRKKALILAERLDQEMEDRGSDYSDNDPYNHSEDEGDKWDCNTILTTHTNKDNHPGVIKTTRVVKQKAKIELHKQFKVPVDGLIAEEISVTKKEKQLKKKDKILKGPYEKVDEEIESDKGDDEDEDSHSDKDDGDQEDGDAKNMKKQRKKQLKEEKREKRKLKKDLKTAFKNQNTRLVKQTTTEIGQIKSGVSVRKIY